VVNTLLGIFANDVLPIFIVASVGFVVGRAFNADVRSISRITFNALSPCLVFTMLVRANIGADAFLRMALLAILTILAIGLVARLVALPFRLDRATLSALLLVVMFSNTGNYGLPVVLFAFGEEALAQATVYFATNAVLTYTAGVFVASLGRESKGRALMGVLKVPPVYGLAAAGIVVAWGGELPVAISRPVELMGAAAIPMMILLLGMQLDRGAWPERPALVVVATALCLLVRPLVALVGSEGLAVGEAGRQAAVLQAGMPSAVMTTVLAVEFNVAPSLVTACVLFSTLVSPITVTLLIALLR
jgi:malate permease and related proteins